MSYPDPERAERLLIALLTLALLVGIGVVAYNKLKPAERIKIGRFSVGNMPAAVSPAAAAVNINKADAEELMRLKGVGKELARRIVEYRSSKGLFITKEDIKKVGGVGGSLYNKIKDGISLE